MSIMYIYTLYIYIYIYIHTYTHFTKDINNNNQLSLYSVSWVLPNLHKNYTNYTKLL